MTVVCIVQDLQNKILYILAVCKVLNLTNTVTNLIVTSVKPNGLRMKEKKSVSPKCF